MEKNGTPASPATARASRVLPVPGWPYSSTPLGILAPTAWNFAGSARNSLISSSSSMASSQPATSLNVVLGVSLLAICSSRALWGPSRPGRRRRIRRGGLSESQELTKVKSGELRGQVHPGCRRGGRNSRFWRHRVGAAGRTTRGWGGPPPPPPTPQAAAPIDLTGNWVSVVTEDWRWRMVTPPKGDFASVPLNPEGRKNCRQFVGSRHGWLVPGVRRRRADA